MNNSETFDCLRLVKELFPSAEGLWDKNGNWIHSVSEVWSHAIRPEESIRVKAAIKTMRTFRRYRTPVLADLMAELRTMREASRPRAGGRTYVASPLDSLRRATGLGPDVSATEVVGRYHARLVDQYGASPHGFAQMLRDLQSMAQTETEEAMYLATQVYGEWPEEEAKWRERDLIIQSTLSEGGNRAMWRLLKSRLRGDQSSLMDGGSS